MKRPRCRDDAAPLRTSAQAGEVACRRRRAREETANCTAVWTSITRASAAPPPMTRTDMVVFPVWVKKKPGSIVNTPGMSREASGQV